MACILRTRRATISSNPVLNELQRRLSGDGRFDDGKILGSMCSRPHLVAQQAFDLYLETNIGDEGLVPGLAELEREAVALLGAWWGHPGAVGRIVTGGTEANLLALWTAKVQAGPGKFEVVLPASAHYSFDKAASLMGLTLVRVPVDSWGRVIVAQAEAAIGPRTVALIGIAGTTALGAVDDFQALAAVALRKKVYFHLDASFGGFVVPVLREVSWPQGLSSLCADPHKMGRGPIPSGMILWRDAELARLAATEVSYLSGGALRQNTVVGTRSGAAVAAVWSVMKYLGREGYGQVVAHAMELTNFLTRELGAIPGVEAVLTHPEVNVVGVRGKHLSPSVLVARLREKGWALSLWESSFRVVLMPHVTREVLGNFLADLQEVVS